MKTLPLRILAALTLTATLSQPALSAGTTCFRGINISGAEFGPLGGKVDKVYRLYERVI